LAHANTQTDGKTGSRGGSEAGKRRCSPRGAPSGGILGFRPPGSSSRLQRPAGPPQATVRDPAPRVAGIGHNNPPEAIEDTEATEALRKDVVDLHAELGKPNPSIAFVKKLGAALGKATLESIKWAGKKVDLAINTAITTGIPAIGVIVGATYNDQIHKAIDAVRVWLEIVAQKF
jgi:hypothetical protein